MEIRHNGILVAIMGDVVGLKEIELFLLANGSTVPINEVQLVYTVSEVKSARQSAYKLESDSLYMEWKSDKTPESEQAWRDKLAEIKARYPFPTEN